MTAIMIAIKTAIATSLSAILQDRPAGRFLPIVEGLRSSGRSPFYVRPSEKWRPIIKAANIKVK